MTEKLKIATWNCKGAYRKKQQRLLAFCKPDIWIIQECEHPDKFAKEKGFEYSDNYVWYGENQNRGIGVFANNGIKLELDNNHNPDFKFIIPVNVSGKYNLKLFAVWTKDEKKGKRKQRYISQLYCAIDYYEIDSSSDTLIIGDYNWNANFDSTSYGLHGNFVNFLEQMDVLEFSSAYHKFHNEQFGHETTPTLYFRGEKNRTFHIDYIFLSKSLSERIDNVTIGNWKDWHLLTDHMPINIEIK